MRGQFFRSGNVSGFQFDNRNSYVKGKSETGDGHIKQKEADDDLIIEDNTVYEIDRECYERMRKQKKR
jgi:hypothetical protein